MKKLITLFSILAFLISACNQQEKKEIIDYVNPLIGTDGHGHTYPGATLPFGMVQLSPDTRKDSWDGCSGYHYSDSVVFGFSHTHLSGTGVGDYGDIRFMPMTNGAIFYPGTAENPDSGYASRFSHSDEIAEAGYYKTYLSDYDIKVELTTTERTGFHKYTFGNASKGFVVLDLWESVTSDKILSTEINIIDKYSFSGHRVTRGWSKEQHIYFYGEFSEAFAEPELIFNTDDSNADGGDFQLTKAGFEFVLNGEKELLLKVGISAVDIEGAKNNMLQENPDWNFESVKQAAQKKWNQQLSKIEIEGGSNEQKTTFYTALYHSFLAPNLYSDFDGRFRGHDLKIHQNKEKKMYTVFSLWDTFRTLHPLFSIIEKERTSDFIWSMMNMYEHDSLLPVWELAANETNCMIGYHAVPVILDAYTKDIQDFDAEKALEAMVASAKSGLFGLDELMKKGYIPADKEGASVSRLLEYAYDDWCIAEMAKLLGKEDIYKEFTQRAQYYKNIFDKENGFFRGKSNGMFVEPFDPTEVNFMLTEANTWQYNFFVPQDINTHIEMIGGDDVYEAKLDELFHAPVDLSGRHQPDITGLIGQYAHGNEPSHHMAYLYNYVGQAWKSQEIVRQIMDEMYHEKPDGLCGNEDCGQMSAWYVMSAMGFFPVTPGSNTYVIGTPLFEEIKINLENGKTLEIEAENTSSKNKYVQSIEVDEQAWTNSFITYDMIKNGGQIEFEMGSSPNIEFGAEIENRPIQKINDHLVTPLPYFKAKSKTFSDSLVVSFGHFDPAVKMMYTLNNYKELREYTEPVVISESSSFTSILKYEDTVIFEHAKYTLIPHGRSVTIKNKYNSQYTAGGDVALINTLRGSNNFTTGNWQGYEQVDLDVTIDLGEMTTISKMGAGFLQDQNSWIWMPALVEYEVSSDGENFKQLGIVINRLDDKKDGGIVKDFEIEFKKQNIRYIRVFAKNKAVCPDWHRGAGEKCWLFADEIYWE